MTGIETGRARVGPPALCLRVPDLYRSAAGRPPKVKPGSVLYGFRTGGHFDGSDRFRAGPAAVRAWQAARPRVIFGRAPGFPGGGFPLALALGADGAGPGSSASAEVGVVRGSHPPAPGPR